MQRGTEAVEAQVEREKRADDAAEEDAAEQVEQVPGVDREPHADDDGEEADATHDGEAQALGQPIAEERAEEPADEHCARVEERPRAREQIAA